MELSGISTGIDTASMVKQLMAVSQQRLYTYKVKKNEYEDRNIALDELRAKLNAFNSSLSALSNADNLKGFKATSSDTDILTAKAATTGVFEGNHEIEVNQLANSERWVHSGFLQKESYIGAGNFIYSYNHEEVIISTDAETTLEDLAGLINNDNSNPGVTATILKYDDGNDGVYHLMLSGNDAGSDYQISINSSTTQVLAANANLEVSGEDATLSTKLVDLDQFSGTLLGAEQISISGTGSTPKTLNFTAETTVGHFIDRINDAFDGVAKAKFEDGKITLTDDVSGGNSTTLVLSLTGAGGGDPASLAFPTFSTATIDGGTAGGGSSGTNPLLAAGLSFTRTLAAQDSQIRVNGYPENEVQTLSSVGTSPTTGTYTLTYDGQTTGNIAANASNADIQTALELLSNVNANDITVSGSLNAGDVKFTFASSVGDASMISIDPALLNQSIASNYSVEETASAWMISSSNSVSDALPGITMELYDVGTVQISLNKDTGSLKGKLKGLVTSYNAAISFIKEKTAYDEETKAAGVLMRSYTTRVIQNLMRTGMRTQAAGFTEGEEEYIYAYQIGLDFSNDQESLGSLTLDEAMLDEAIENDYDAVAALIGATDTGRSSGTDSDIIGFSDSSGYTEAGEYEIEIITDGSNNIQQVKVKHSSETQWHYQPASSWENGNTVTIEGRLNAESDEWYPERDLQLTVDKAALGASQTYTATIHVQQGFAGALKDRLKDVLDTTSTLVNDQMVPNGYLAVDTESGKTAMTNLDARIEREEIRLKKKEERLTAKFARLEKTMTILQQQFSALSIMES